MWEINLLLSFTFLAAGVLYLHTVVTSTFKLCFTASSPGLVSTQKINVYKILDERVTDIGILLSYIGCYLIFSLQKVLTNTTFQYLKHFCT